MEKVYTGWLTIGENQEEEETLFLISTNDKISLKLTNKKIDFTEYEPFISILQDDIKYNYISVRYYICDKEITVDEANIEYFKQICGAADIRYRLNYSEYTGYLYCDEFLKIGYGHDLVPELYDNADKYLILIIDISIPDTVEKIKLLKENRKKILENMWEKPEYIEFNEGRIKSLDSDIKELEKQLRE